MNAPVIIKSYTEPPFCEREILRYAGCGSGDGALLDIMHECIKEAREKLVYKACFTELSLSVSGDTCGFGAFKVCSKALARSLVGCKSVIVFAATVGIELDRLIAKYGRLAPSKALFMQAIGAERIEALCDAFCADLKREKGITLKPRFSPGYSDLPLSIQRDIFSLLDCPKRIGLSLNESLLMSPSKSVTAFAGVVK